MHAPLGQYCFSVILKLVTQIFNTVIACGKIKNITYMNLGKIVLSSTWVVYYLISNDIVLGANWRNESWDIVHV